MRHPRSSVGAAAALLVAAPAGLAPSPAAAAASAAAASSSAAARPLHSLKVDAKEIDSANRFVLYGKVETYPAGRIVVTRSVAGGPYHRLEKIGTSGNGRFRQRIYQVDEKLTCFKVVVPATPNYRRTVSTGSVCIETG